MAEKRYLHVSFRPSGFLKPEDVEPIFRPESDWLRYMTNCWILYTAASAATLRDRLRKVKGLEDALIFICAFDIANEDTTGWLTQEIWDWLRSRSAEK